MQTFYQIVGLPTGNLDMLTREQFDALYPDAVIRAAPHTRPELHDQPDVKGLCGGMWGGWRSADGEYVSLVDDRDPTSARASYCKNDQPIVGYAVRYETWAAYEALSR